MADGFSHAEQEKIFLKPELTSKILL